MTQTEYEHKRRECWEEFWKDGNLTPHNINQAFNYAFDHAYALGKQQKTIAQEDIEKAAEAFATPPIGNGGMFTREQVKELLVRFAQLLLNKQEKDADANIKFQKQ